MNGPLGATAPGRPTRPRGIRGAGTSGAWRARTAVGRTAGATDPVESVLHGERLQGKGLAVPVRCFAVIR